MLFEDERINTYDGDNEIEPMTNEQIDQKYARGEVRIVTEQGRYPLVTIPTLLKNTDQYKLNPEYQRRHRWNNGKRSKLIESFIINVPVPPIFLYENEYSSYEVMDGLQRLTTIIKFYNNEFALEGLTEWKELNGMLYSELPGLVQKGIDRRYISSVILLQETAKTKYEALRLKQMVFERINSGGEKLTHQESRNAIYDGPLNQLCMNLSDNANFKNLWKIEIDDNADADYQENKFYRTMQDVELVLRFFANRQSKDLQKGDLTYLKDYLDYYLIKGNFFPDSVLSSLGTIFVETINLARTIFGEKAFWLYKQRNNRWGWYDRPTTVVYDPLMFALSQFSEKSEFLLEKKNKIHVAIEGFYKKNRDLFEGRTTTRTIIANREEKFLEFFNNLT